MLGVTLIQHWHSEDPYIVLHLQNRTSHLKERYSENKSNWITFQRTTWAVLIHCSLEGKAEGESGLSRSVFQGKIQWRLRCRCVSGGLLSHTMSAHTFSLKTEFNKGHKRSAISIKQPRTKEGNPAHSPNGGQNENQLESNLCITNLSFWFSLTQQFHVGICPNIVTVDRCKDSTRCVFTPALF